MFLVQLVLCGEYAKKIYH